MKTCEEKEVRKEKRKDIKYMKMALDLAQKGAKKWEVPVGAVIVKDDKVIAKAYNKKEEKCCSNYHAEMIAIEKACKKLGNWRLNDCTMYVTLEPCTMCAGAIVLSRVGRLVVSCKDPKTGAFGSIFDINQYDLNHKVDVSFGVLEENSSLVVKDFFQRLRNKKKYDAKKSEVDFEKKEEL